MGSIQSAFAGLPTPLFNSELESRRMFVLDWLRFVHDFGQIDTSKLIEQATWDDDFIDAVQAVIETSANAAASFDAVRSFAIQRLLGETPQKTSAARLSPYSVPVGLLHEVFASRVAFSARQLAIYSWKHIFSDQNIHRSWYERVGAGSLALLTTLRAHVLSPPGYQFDDADAAFEIDDVASNRLTSFPVPLQS